MIFVLVSVIMLFTYIGLLASVLFATEEDQYISKADGRLIKYLSIACGFLLVNTIIIAGMVGYFIL